MNELKPCPFCGASISASANIERFAGKLYIRCGRCMSRCGMRDGVDAAERLWNSRGNNATKLPQKYNKKLLKILLPVVWQNRGKKRAENLNKTCIKVVQKNHEKNGTKK